MPGFPMPDDPNAPVQNVPTDPGANPTVPFSPPGEPAMEPPPPPVAAEVTTVFSAPPQPQATPSPIPSFAQPVSEVSLIGNEPPPPPIGQMPPEEVLSPEQPPVPQPLPETMPISAPMQMTPTTEDPAMFRPTEASPPPMEPPPVSATPAPASLPPQPSPLPKILIIVLIVLVLGGLAFGAFKLLTGGTSTGTTPKGTTKKTEPVQITYWGLWESPQIMQPVIDQFQKDNPDITVSYQLQSQVDYRERLQTALSKGTAPDVVRMHSSWLPMMYTSLQSAPADTLTSTEIQANFYPAAQSAVVLNNQAYGAPTTMDGLALFTNTSIFSTVQATIPKTWEDVRAVAKQLTQRDPQGKIIRAGIAMGTTNNVDSWPDIVTLMLLQNGVTPMSPQTQYTTEALKFYTLFVNTDQVWDSTLPSSIQAFASGKVAMILAPSWRALDIQALNPQLTWQVSPVPQLPGSTPVSLVHFWIETVPKSAAHPAQAWRFVKYLASSQAQQLLWNSASQARGFGQAPASKALAETVSTNPVIGPYVQQAQFGQTFYTIADTHDGDTGIDSRLTKYLEDAVNTFSARTVTDDSVVSTLQQGFNQVLASYNLVQPLATPSGSGGSLSAQ